MIGVAVYTHLAKARIETTRQSALKIRQTVVLYRMDHGDDCPTVDMLKQDDLIDAASKHGSEDDIVAPEPPPRVVTRE